MSHYRFSALLLASVLALAGCASTHIQTEAFKKPRSLAMVSVAGVVEGLATSDAEDAQFMNNLVSITQSELGHSRHIKLAPESAVKKSKAFAAIKDQGPMMFQEVAKGYKRFDPKEETANLKRMASEIKVDGFIGIMAHYGTAKKGLGLGGIFPVPVPVSVGREYVKVSYTVFAFDAEGEIFWQDTAAVTDDEGITTAMGLGQYKSLHPRLVTVTKAAVKQVLDNLDTRLAGK